MNTGVRVVNKRPHTVQQQWDQHVDRKSTAQCLWKIFRLAVIPVIVLAILVLAAVPLAFG